VKEFVYARGAFAPSPYEPSALKFSFLVEAPYIA